MVYTLSVKYLSFKQDLSNIEAMLDDQVSTYAVLKYCDEIPDKVWRNAVLLLIDKYNKIKSKGLKAFLDEFISVKRFL